MDIAGVDRKRAEYGHVSLNGARIVINVVNLQSEGKKKRGLRSMTVERMTREFRYEGAADPSFDAGQAYVVYDGHELRPAGMPRRRSPRWCGPPTSRL